MLLEAYGQSQRVSGCFIWALVIALLIPHKTPGSSGYSYVSVPIQRGLGTSKEKNTPPEA